MEGSERITAKRSIADGMGIVKVYLGSGKFGDCMFRFVSYDFLGQILGESVIYFATPGGGMWLACARMAYNRRTDDGQTSTSLALEITA